MTALSGHAKFWIGVLMIGMLFGGIFVAMAGAMGLHQAIMVFSLSAFSVGWIVAAVALIASRDDR